jgi:very-short-patch-repair endonuclease
MSTVDNSKVIQIFEYLLAVKNLKEKITRNISEYDRVWWQEDITNLEGCFLGGSGHEEDAWLEVHKQIVPPVPALPKILNSWVNKWDNPDKEPINMDSKLRGIDSETKDELFEFFSDNNERVSSFKEWLTQKWRPWATEASPKLRIQKLYDELFALHQQLQREGENLEIGWGHGLLSWNVSGESINRHLLVTKMELQFNAKKGIFTLIPTSKGTMLETDMLMNISIPNAARMQEMEMQIGEMEFSTWERCTVAPIFKEIVHTISSNGQYLESEDRLVKGTTTPKVTYSPAIFLRKSGGRIWQKELSTVIQKIRDGYPVPSSIVSLTTTDEQVSSFDTSPSSIEWRGVGEELLFPLPANAEQKLIACKLAYNDGVIVQGPPGTGKSHTIANLICHLLAHGKRVLVTSEKERALQVLRNKIPEEVRALCVSVLGGDSKSVKEIEDSIRDIAENLDSKQPEVLSKNIERMRMDLDHTKRLIAQYNHNINKAAEEENEQKSFGEYTLTPLEATKWLKVNEMHSWLPDKLEISVKYPLTIEESSLFFNLLGIILTEDQLSLNKYRASTENIASPSVFRNHVNNIIDIEQKIEETEASISGWNPPLTNELNLSELINFVTETSEKLEMIQAEGWLTIILEEILAFPNKHKEWQEFYDESQERIKRINQLSNELIEDVIDIPSELNLTLLKEDLLPLKQRFTDKKGVNWLFKSITGRKYNYIFEKVKINSLPIRSVEDINKLEKFIDRADLTKKFVLKWNRTLEEYRGPQLEASQSRLTSTVMEYLQLFNRVLHWDTHVVKPMKPKIQHVGVPGEPDWDNAEWFLNLKLGLIALQYKTRWKEAQIFFSDLLDQFQRYNTHPNPHPSIENILIACKTRDIQSWKRHYQELLRLESIQGSYDQFNTLKEKLEGVAPKWVKSLLLTGGTGEPMVPPTDLRVAWTYSQVNKWISELQSKPKIEDIELELQRERRKESQLIQELAAESTWKAQIERTTREQKRSLVAWLNAIKRIGKGTGKYANVYRKEASKEMKTARGAIPVWIMPIQRVIENIELTNELFDVVIVDESSQSTLFSLSALLRGKKTVIVGDDNQISPETVGSDISEVHELIERHLYNIPNKLQFELKTSLYDTASRIFESKIILKEHFRCVPEIIQFSNDLMYNGMIDPLRLPLGSEVLEPPVKPIRVENGYRREDTRKVLNEPEAEAVVQQIYECCLDSNYSNKSFGVISLQGQDQAKLIENLLREKIGEEEYLNRKIICGDSYSFQGDERDVIFLSMVAAKSKNSRIGALVKRSDSQRFNVAASRARDQMFLFHSVDLKDLNPEDMRYRLLQYFLDPHRVQKEVDEVKEYFDSPFEEEVFRIITARGYRVIPQVKVGTLGKKIDLVVEGMRNRLAVECDGDQWHGVDKWEDDIERQRVLERVGWTFWRVRGSQFYWNRQKAMESLWVKLDEMGIKPRQMVQ